MSNAKSERSREAGYTVTGILLVFTSGVHERLEVYLCEAKFRGMCVLSQPAESAGNVSDLSPLMERLIVSLVALSRDGELFWARLGV